MYPYSYMNYNMIQNMQALQKSLELIKEAIADEKSDELFYDYLINKAPTKEEKEIITAIRDDEKKHNKMFKEIYKELAGIEPYVIEDGSFKEPENYIEGVKNALFGELKAVEKYRKIREGIHGNHYRDKLFEIITDELKHGSRYNYILGMDCSKNNYIKEKGENNVKDPTININKFTPDEWVKYIEPLLKKALLEKKQGINIEHLFQKFILLGVLVGLGKTPMEAIEQVEEWEKTGEIKLSMNSKRR